MVRSSFWYIAARADQLEKKPLARKILGNSIVLFRTRDGAVLAFEDRCPHKNVALSLGRVVGNELECRYHGWRFSSDGNCAKAPCQRDSEAPPRCQIKKYPIVEQDDWIWIWMGEQAPAAHPPSYPKQKGYGWFELHNVMKAPMDLILENGLDCSHTGFVHPGLFRSAPKQTVTAAIEERSSGVCVETREDDSSGLGDVRSVLTKGNPVKHTDELILPHTVRVDYVVGKIGHILTILVCTPEDEETTRVYTRMAVRFRWLTWILTPLLYWVTRVIVAQDKEILLSQAEVIRKFGKRSFTLTQADLPTSWMHRVLEKNQRGEYPDTELKKAEALYKL